MDPTMESPKIQTHQILLKVGFRRMEGEIFDRKPSYRQHLSLRRASARAVSIFSRKLPKSSMRILLIRFRLMTHSINRARRTNYIVLSSSQIKNQSFLPIGQC